MEQNHTIQSLQNLGVKITEAMTTPTRPGKKPRPVWMVSGNTVGLENFFYELGGKKYRGAWSFFRDPSDDILEQLNSKGREGFAEQMQGIIDRKCSRIERFEGYADNASTRSEVAYQNANSIASVIPMGQPILVSHHSERRHRRDLNRIDSGMRKSIEESKKSEHYTHKANFLDYQVKNMTKSRPYMANRIQETAAELARLSRAKFLANDPAYIKQLELRISQETEKIEFWQNNLRELEAEVIAKGGQVATPENLQPGDQVCYRGSWYPVVRVNKKTVTIGNWLDVPTFTFKIEYAGISKFHTPTKEQ